MTLKQELIDAATRTYLNTVLHHEAIEEGADPSAVAQCLAAAKNLNETKDTLKEPSNV